MFEKVNKILDFWMANESRWWVKDHDFDQEIMQLFGPCVNRAINGEIEAWRENPKSCLAYIILLDQFTRNIFRGQPEAFANDHRALAACEHGIEHKLDKELDFLERHFFYMPLEHSEDINHQSHSVALFKRLEEEALELGSPLAATLKGAHDFAVRHYDIINNFGRFPHRNDILGRESTQEELVFLEQPGSSF